MDLYINLAATREMTDSLYNTVRRIAVLHTAIQQNVYIMQIFNSWYAAQVSLKTATDLSSKQNYISQLSRVHRDMSLSHERIIFARSKWCDHEEQIWAWLS